MYKVLIIHQQFQTTTQVRIATMAQQPAQGCTNNQKPAKQIRLHQSKASPRQQNQPKLTSKNKPVKNLVLILEPAKQRVLRARLRVVSALTDRTTTKFSISVNEGVV
jgi:hypothetical protein